jgi:hypothetical protein
MTAADQQPLALSSTCAARTESAGSTIAPNRPARQRRWRRTMSWSLGSRLI